MWMKLDEEKMFLGGNLPSGVLKYKLRERRTFYSEEWLPSPLGPVSRDPVKRKRASLALIVRGTSYI